MNQSKRREDGAEHKIATIAGSNCGATTPKHIDWITRRLKVAESRRFRMGTSSTSPYISITGSYDYAIENETLHKVGLTTGWTYGGVEDTCVDYGNGTGDTIDCSDRVDYSSDHGDSGAPVFAYDDAGSTSAELRGIHWGSSTQWDLSHDGLMSHLAQIRLRLGNLEFYPTSGPNVELDGPLSVKTSLMCTWTAVVTGGLAPFTYDWTGIFTADYNPIEKVATTSGTLYIEVTDALGRTSATSEYITVSPGGPSPPGCTE